MVVTASAPLEPSTAASPSTTSYPLHPASHAPDAAPSPLRDQVGVHLPCFLPSAGWAPPPLLAQAAARGIMIGEGLATVLRGPPESLEQGRPTMHFWCVSNTPNINLVIHICSEKTWRPRRSGTKTLCVRHYAYDTMHTTLCVRDVYARVCSCRQCWASKCRGL
jgi:hypothetical protein